jgi:hypothetical protein
MIFFFMVYNRNNAYLLELCQLKQVQTQLSNVSRHMFNTDRAMCLNMLLPGMVWQMSGQAPMGVHLGHPHSYGVTYTCTHHRLHTRRPRHWPTIHPRVWKGTNLPAPPSLCSWLLQLTKLRNMCTLQAGGGGQTVSYVRRIQHLPLLF